MKDKKLKFPIVYSSYNNYKLFEFEVLPRMRKFKQDIELIVIDDFSDMDEYYYGKKLCEKEGIAFFSNKQKGVSWAVDSAVEYLRGISSVRQDWLFCMQQDIFPEKESFFSDFSSEVEKFSFSQPLVGAVGFNVIDEYYSDGSTEEGLMGSFFLSKKPSCSDLTKFVSEPRHIKQIIRHPKESKEYWISYINQRRFFSPKSLPEFEKVRKLHRGTFSIELPMWAGLAINVEVWKRYISPSPKFIFHLWFNDIAMQLLSQNIHLAVVSNLHLHNYQTVKTKYGFNSSSAEAGRLGLYSQVESYGGHLMEFEKRWGFDYRSPWQAAEVIKKRFQGTLVEQYFNHRFKDGPILDFNV